MSDRIDSLVAQLVPTLRVVGSMRKCGSSAAHALLSKRRADHDRVPKADLEAELRLSRLANDGQQSEAARVIGVTEGALRHWRNPDKADCLPPRWAIEELQRKRQEAAQSRRAAG